jgi:hypothetical protein
MQHQHSQTIKEWFTADELRGVDGLPRCRSSFSKKATKEHWHKRQRSGCRGAAFEYHITSLPEQAQLALRNTYIANGASTTLPMIWTMTDDSMNPTIQTGEQVAFIYPLNTNENGLYLVNINEQITLRRVQWIENQQQYAVLCDNPSHTTLYIDNLTILAKVTGVLSSVQ